MAEKYSFWERLKSPVVIVAVLYAIYQYVEVTDFTNWRATVLGAIGIAITTFSALNNPTDRDHM